MADQKISELTEDTSPATGDFVPTDDVSAGSNKKVQIGNLLGLQTVVQLSQIVTAASQATVDFTSISSAYSSLLVTFQSQDTTSGTSGSSVYLKFNNDGTSGNYTSANRIGVQNGAVGGVTELAATGSGMYIFEHPNAGNTSMAADGSLLIPNYTGTTFHKEAIATFRAEWSGNRELYTFAARWKSTAAVSRLTFAAATAFTNGSVFTLYGVR